jgi:hypothetical protein
MQTRADRIWLEGCEMESRELLGCVRWMLLAAIGPVGWAQSVPPVAVTAPRGGAAAVAATKAVAAKNPWRITNLRFNREKAVLGLPVGTSKTKAHCSVDGTVFIDVTGNAATAGQELYGISPDGEVAHLSRKLPIDFTNVSVRDFFAGDHTLVTLLEAVKRDDGTEASPPRETDYFVSLEDEAGDLSDLVQMQLRFRPVKIARFGSGDVVVLGWDEGNLLPVLAFVKTDGTIHRFVDLDERRSDVTSDATAAKATVQYVRDTLEVLQGAAFAAYGSEVMLTYPGTTKPVRVMTNAGELRTIPISIPAGYVLNDVLASGSRWTMVVRVRETEDAKKAKSEDAADKSKMRLFEFDSTHGNLLRELIPDKPAVSEVTCAADSTVTAMFYDTIPDASTSMASSGPTTAATQLVVATARR